MRKNKFKSALVFFLVIGPIFLVTCCASTSHVLGRWQEIGKTATLEFRKDGSFRAVDNEGMAVSGKYSLKENGMVRFEIANPGSSPEIVTGKISVQEDELNFTSARGSEVERYRKMK